MIAAKAKGISIFKNLDELNKKESPRLKWGSKILKMMGVKVITTKNSIKIFGNPGLKIDKRIEKNTSNGSNGSTTRYDISKFARTIGRKYLQTSPIDI